MKESTLSLVFLVFLYLGQGFTFWPSSFSPIVLIIKGSGSFRDLFSLDLISNWLWTGNLVQNLIPIIGLINNYNESITWFYTATLRYTPPGLKFSLFYPSPYFHPLLPRLLLLRANLVRYFHPYFRPLRLQNPLRPLRPQNPKNVKLIRECNYRLRLASLYFPLALALSFALINFALCLAIPFVALLWAVWM